MSLTRFERPSLKDKHLEAEALLSARKVTNKKKATKKATKGRKIKSKKVK
jgi:hypothetical protein